jgi:hypothetical protein
MKREFIKAQVSDFIKPEEFGIFYHIITNPTISAGLSSGGWIAGGFARAILTGESIVDYLYPEGRRFPTGDIDIFFPNQEAAAGAMSSLESITRQQVRLQPNRFAIDWHLQPSNNMREFFEKNIPMCNKLAGVRIQFVVNPPDGFKTTLLDTINNFDLVNCMVGIEGQYIHFPAEWQGLEESKSLKIAKSDTPFLGRRLSKYLLSRGYENIEESSRDLFIEWVARVHNDEFPGVFNHEHFRKEMMMSSFDKLIEREAIPLTDIVLLVNKWNISKKQSTGNYGPSKYITLDWALDKLQNHVNVT